jgi:hypothetical protein
MKYPHYWGVTEQKQGWHVGFMLPPFKTRGNRWQLAASQSKQKKRGQCESPSLFEMKGNREQFAP